MYGEKTWRYLHKNTASNTEQSWRQHPTKQQLCGHLPPITKAIQFRWTSHAGHCWRSRDELISDVFQWIHSHGREKARRPVRNYIQQLCADTGCSPEDLPEAMDDWEEWRERIRVICIDGATWWWFIGISITFSFFFHTHTHTHTYTRTYIFICACVSDKW